METYRTSKIGPLFFFFFSHPERLPSGHLLLCERNTARFLYLVFQQQPVTKLSASESKASNPELVTAVASAKMSQKSTEKKSNILAQRLGDLEKRAVRFGKEMIFIGK